MSNIIILASNYGKASADMIKLSYASWGCFCPPNVDFELTIHNGVVSYKKGEYIEKDWVTVVAHTPPEDELKKFSKTLDSLKFWDWKEEYKYGNNFTDVSSWMLSIEVCSLSNDRPEPKTIRTGGTIEYPPNMDILINAINELMTIKVL